MRTSFRGTVPATRWVQVGLCLAGLGCMAVGGCSTGAPKLAGPGGLNIPMGMVVRAQPVKANMPALRLPRAPMFDWITGEFFPPGSHAILPPGFVEPLVVETPGAWFPSIGYELMVDVNRLGNAGSIRFLRGYDRGPNPKRVAAK